MTDDELRSVVRSTINETLISLGIDHNEYVAMQKDFAFLRAWRESTAAIKRQGIVTATITVVVAGMGLIWLTIKGHP